MYISYNEACARDCSDLWSDLNLCEKYGFDYIEIRLDMLRKFLVTGTVKKLCSFFDKSHLKPHALNAVYLRRDLFVADEVNFNDPVMKDFILACEVGKTINSHYIIIVPPFDASGVFSGDLQDAKKDCIRILKKLSQIARPYKMNLCFELVGLKKSCVRTVKVADQIVRAVDEDNVGFVFDSYNIYLYTHCNDFKDITRVQPEKIFAVHMMSADDVPECDMGQDKRCFVGSGVIDANVFLQTLKLAKYKGMVSVETFRPQYWQQSPEWVIKNAYQTTYEALKVNGCLQDE